MTPSRTLGLSHWNMSIISGGMYATVPIPTVVSRDFSSTLLMPKSHTYKHAWLYIKFVINTSIDVQQYITTFNDQGAPVFAAN